MQENSVENVVCSMSAILFRPQCVDKFWSVLVFGGNGNWLAEELNIYRRYIIPCWPADRLDGKRKFTDSPINSVF